MKPVRVCVIALGYVSLPLTRLFSTKFTTTEYDLNGNRVNELIRGHDITGEVPDDLLLT